MIAPKHREEITAKTKNHFNNNREFYEGLAVGAIGGVLGILLVVTFKKTPVIFLNVEYPVTGVPVQLLEA